MKADQVKWNQKHKDKLSQCSLHNSHNLSLNQLSHHLKGEGRALDVACGLGANSIYLAKLGYKVTSIDISDVAIQHVKQVAEQHNLTIDPVVVDLDNADFKINHYDLVIVTYFLDRRLFTPLRQCLKDNGLLFMETFFVTSSESTNSQISHQFKLKPNELRDLFSDWTILHFNQNEETGIQTILARK